MASAIKDRLRYFVHASGEEDQQTLERGDPADVAFSRPSAGLVYANLNVMLRFKRLTRQGAWSQPTTAVQ
jgi:hypothetical protein